MSEKKESGSARVDPTVEGHGGSFLDMLAQASPVPEARLRGSGLRPLPGTSLLGGRFAIRRQIGEGGMGVVFEAYDELRRSAVAIKTLSWLDSGSVYRLKNEFRSLAEIRHPNLCRLHELFSDEGWFFSMEMVDGERFDAWVRPEGRLDVQRLRTALAQLLDGVMAIHAAGMLHRDLKSSNVLVDKDGRVVVLDFGLVVDGHAGATVRPAADLGFSGTPGYMAPEQTWSAPHALPTTASDMYAIGSILFTALTGRLPFEGPLADVLERKRQQAAPPVRNLCAEAPHDLAELCDALLQRDPAARPDAARMQAVLARANAQGGTAPLAASATAQEEPTGPAPRADVLLGRESEMAALHAAHASMLAGRPVVMFVSGESGMGKSALLHAFLDQVRADGRSVALEGRCYDRESVPFKAFDSVMDELGSHLHGLSHAEAGELMPREMYALARLFPVLERVEAVARAPKKPTPDLQDLRLRAFAALSELLGRMRDRRPLVIFVDDLQWTDSDSIVVFEYLLSQPEPTPFLWVATHRSEGAKDNALLQKILGIPARSPQVDCRSLHVGPLPPAVSVQLAQRLLGSARSADFGAIAAEGGGSPFFVGELVRLALSDWRTGAGPDRLTLGQSVDRHIGLLPEKARDVLNVLAVAGRPISAQLAVDAAHATHEALDALLFERLARTARVNAHSRVLECYHDKIRESVADALAPAELRRVHASLADALSMHADAQPEHLALHFHGAGDGQRASVHYEKAGDVFAAALAFEFASRQYRQCLDLIELDPPRFRRVQVKLAAMLASMGNSREAAAVYRAASVGAAPQEALDCKRAAAHLLSTSGYIDEARVLLGEVLAAVGLSMPRSPQAAIFAALASRFMLMCRGLKIDPAATPGPGVQARLGAMWSVVQGSVGNDPFVMVDMAARYARLALNTGSAAHAARALSMEAYMASFDGPGTRAKTEPILLQAERLAAEVSQNELTGWVREIRGCVLAHEGRFTDAQPVLQDALEWLGSQCTEVPFELASTHLYTVNVANHLGDFARTSTTAPGIVENALRRGDQYLACGVVSFAAPALLAHRGLADAGPRIGQAKASYQVQSVYQWADYLILLADMNLALYEGQPARGMLLAARQWPALQKSQLLRMKTAFGLVSFYRAACAVAAARQGSTDVAAALGIARTTAVQLNRSRLPHLPGWAAVIEAGLACEKQQPDRASALLQAATAIFDATGLKLYGAAARRRQGQLMGGEAGRAMSIAGEAVMHAQGVIDLEATTEMLAPGCRAR
ncbi:serine/threonine-protein kinase [Variovorax saccharolyticus]|uniref:serine/threonine-protein kinase n=1 Tax=Variovorax saccharolyticus TaxID=3053516 RepID=UPI002574E737|nr:serine/threonine-protein kinase [Variovorax sp. J31P216]MDM0026481.1 AAA family ATPase [Variovorax sp. J31P216]